MKDKITLKSALEFGRRLLEQNEIMDSQYDSFAILSDLFKIDKASFLLHSGKEIEQEEFEEYRKRVLRRAQHEPLQHILGYAYFWNYQFLVNENVLIPRQDTEVLIEETLKRLKKEDIVLDMCTGSGCIILTLLLERPLARGVGVDISSEALKVAAYNQRMLHVKNVDWIQNNLLKGLKEKLSQNIQFDLIVSNPPYIKTEEIEKLTPEVREHDPFLALDGHGDGLYFYRQITNESAEILKKGGWLLYEIGFDQAEAVTHIMEENGFCEITVTKDLSGLDRVVSGRKL